MNGIRLASLNLSTTVDGSLGTGLPTGSTIVLSYRRAGTGDIRVWKRVPDGSSNGFHYSLILDRAHSTAIWDDPSSTLYVEGLSESTNQGDVELDATYQPPAFVAQANPVLGAEPQLPKGPVGKAKVSIPDVQIDPVTSQSFRAVASAPLNSIHNPAGIVVEQGDAISDDTVAWIQITSTGKLFNDLKNDDDRVHWRIEGQGGAEFYKPNGGAPDDTGKTVRIYGTGPGLISLIAYTDNNGVKTDLAQYDAQVVQSRALPFRVENLHGINGGGSRATDEQIAQHIAIANIYLRQLGVTLKPDRNGIQPATLPGNPVTVTPKSGMNGYFDLQIPTSDVDNLPDPGTQYVHDSNVAKVNYLAKTVQILYSGSHHAQGVNAPPPVLGVTLGSPGNSWDANTSLTYIADLKADHFVAQPHKLKRLHAAANINGAPNDWAIMLYSGDIGGADNLQKYGLTIAHEIGHLLGLQHREALHSELPTNDGLGIPAAKNAMASGSDASHEDFDLLQVAAVQKSDAFA